ncbi:MAG: lamin tail domain-containing protein [Clostridiales bacterium]|nr:lamin tail domain-containing protein [Clostridiales bacterium]
MKPIKVFLLIVLAVLFVVTLVLSLRCASQDGLGPQGARCPVIVNEIMTGNKGVLLDPFGRASDYVEFYNASDEPVRLDGFLLSDREDKSWYFPTGTEIGPYGYLIVWCTGDAVDNALIANFKLSKGDVLRFADAAGYLLFVKEIPEIFSPNALCLAPAGHEWKEMPPSPGFANTPEGIAAFAASRESGGAAQVILPHNGVYISEFMASNKMTLKAPDGSVNDWIELYNTTDRPVDLSGCGLSNDPDKPYKFTFPEGALIEPYGFLLVYRTARSVEGFYCFSFGISKQGGTLVLTDRGGTILDKVTFGPQKADCSMIRSMEGRDFDPAAAFEETGQPSPGFANNHAGWEAYDKQIHPNLGVHDIMLSEVLVSGYSWYLGSNGRPQDRELGEWVELFNKGDTERDIGGYSLSDVAYGAGKWVFPEGTSIAAKGYLVVLLKGGGKPDSGRYLELSFDIKAGGEPLSLFDNEQNLIDRVSVPKSRAGVAYARQGDGGWALTENPTPNAANQSGRRGVCPTPVFSVDSGLYHEGQSVTITVPEGCFVTYTEDCTDPTEQSPRYQVGTAISVGGNKVLRARAFASDGGLWPSDIASNTYILVLGEETAQSHNTSLNMVFLVTDPANLFDPKFGIYVIGDTIQAAGVAATDWSLDTDKHGRPSGANFSHRGRSWERPAHFTYLSKGGESVSYEDELMIRIFGGFSRWRRQKGIALIPRKGYGPSRLDYAFFDDRPFDSYQSLVLRASAMDNNLTKIRDILVHGLAADAKLNLATQAYVQCTLYLNGQYWGVYNLREKINSGFIAQHYSIKDKQTIDLLRGNGALVSGSKQGQKDYEDLIAYCKARNYKLDDAAYRYVCERIDVENFALYCALEIAVGNTDTGNIKFWRSSELDGKWRWLIYDFDWAMNQDRPEDSDTVTSGYRRDFFTKYFSPGGHGAGSFFSTTLSRSLLSRNEFVEIFLRYCALMVNEVYSTDAILAKVDELAGNIRQEIFWDNTHWGLTAENWEPVHVANIRKYAENYPDRFLKYCQDYINNNTNYRLTDAKMIEIFGRKSNL